jgi:ureidoacrylate peracid hydrolase
MRRINGVDVLDTLEEIIDPAHTALAIIDVQNDFCHADGHFARHGKDLGSIQAMVPKLVEFVAQAQALGLRCVFIQQATLPHGASDSPAWLRFKCRDGKSSEYTLQGSWGWQVVDGLQPAAGDLAVQKFRPDAFLATPLDRLLRANGIETLVLFGTTTEGCVESTVRTASYLDYYVVVAKDLVASPNAVQHEGSMRLYEARYPMATSDALLGIWRGKASRKDVAA